MRFFGVKRCLNEILFVSMILQWDKVVKLHLESFRSSYLIHFWPEQRKSRKTDTRFQWNKKNFLCSTRMSRVEWPRISISPMPDPECHDAECLYAKCHYGECHYAECHFAKCRFAECHFAECHFAECHYAYCRNADNSNISKPLK
jgi:hypothetical protein